MNQLNVFRNQQIEAIHNWMIANNLTLNINEFNIILIKSNENYQKISFDESNTAFTKLPTASCAKYLSVTSDDLLAFDIHINNLLKTV